MYLKQTVSKALPRCGGFKILDNFFFLRNRKGAQYLCDLPEIPKCGGEELVSRAEIDPVRTSIKYWAIWNQLVNSHFRRPLLPSALAFPQNLPSSLNSAPTGLTLAKPKDYQDVLAERGSAGPTAHHRVLFRCHPTLVQLHHTHRRAWPPPAGPRCGPYPLLRESEQSSRGTRLRWALPSSDGASDGPRLTGTEATGTLSSFGADGRSSDAAFPSHEQ